MTRFGAWFGAPEDFGITSPVDDEKRPVELLERGQRTAVGMHMLLWSIRRVFDEQRFGISMLCSVMSKPNAMAWDNATSICT